MKKLRHFLIITHRRTWILLAILLIVSVAIIIAACGKLNDDSDRPFVPSGSSGGQLIPMALPDELGSYKLTVSADDTRVPADGVTYTGLHARLSDRDGRSLENFIINFNTTPQSDAIGIFLNPNPIIGTGTVGTTTSGRTSESGSVSVRLYGVLSGSCIVQASIDIDQDGRDDLYDTVVVVFTPAGPPNTAGGYTLYLSANPESIAADGVAYSTITATLTDASGGTVENFSISFLEPTGLGQFEGSATTYTGVTDQNGKVNVRFFGITSGVAVIQARVFVNDLIGELQKTVQVRITSGPGVPGSGIAGIYLTADQTVKSQDAGTCGANCADISFTLNAAVWDENGDEVGSGVRVEFYEGGTLVGFSDTAANGVATVTATITLCPTAVLNPATGSRTILAETYIAGTRYTDTITITGQATCTVPTPTPSPTPTPTPTPTP